MLLNNGELNGYRFLNESSIADLTAPHTQLESPTDIMVIIYGYGDSTLLSHGDTGLWMGGGTKAPFLIDTKRQFVGI